VEPSWELRLIAGADGALLSAAEKLGVRAEVLPLPDELLVLGHSVWRTVRATWGSRVYARALRARIGHLAPDIVHSNGSKFHVLTRLIGKQAAPVVWHLRDFMGAGRFMRHALRWAAPAAALAIATSEAVARDARAAVGRLPVRVVLNAIDTERFSPGFVRGESLDELGSLPPATKGTLRVGLLASYARWKGHDLFIQAAARVTRDAPELNVRYYVVGGPLFETQGSQFSRAELQRLAAAWDVAKRVGFIPFQNEPQDAYRALDVVVHASTKPEPFGRTIAEAMACGKPVIASLEGGVPELIRPGVDALGFPPNDVAALAANIVSLLRDEKLRQTLGENARRAAVERFSRTRLGPQMRAIYADLSATR
jgi:glycosyltransferase involved in cell wall biosynthesis